MLDVQPAGGTAGAAFATQPRVRFAPVAAPFATAAGATGATATATLLYGSYTGSGALVGATAAAQPAGGVLQWASLGVSVAGNFYLQLSVRAPTGRVWTLYTSQFFVSGAFRAQEGPWAAANHAGDRNVTATNGTAAASTRGIAIASVLVGAVVGAGAALAAGFALRGRCGGDERDGDAEADRDDSEGGNGSAVTREPVTPKSGDAAVRSATL